MGFWFSVDNAKARIDNYITRGNFSSSEYNRRLEENELHILGTSSYSEVQNRTDWANLFHKTEVSGFEEYFVKNLQHPELKYEKVDGLGAVISNENYENSNVVSHQDKNKAKYIDSNQNGYIEPIEQAAYWELMDILDDYDKIDERYRETCDETGVIIDQIGFDNQVNSIEDFSKTDIARANPRQFRELMNYIIAQYEELH